LKRQDNGEMEALVPGDSDLNALNGGKSEIEDIFLRRLPSFAPVANWTNGNTASAADSAADAAIPPVRF